MISTLYAQGQLLAIHYIDRKGLQSMSHPIHNAIAAQCGEVASICHKNYKALAIHNCISHGNTRELCEEYSPFSTLHHLMYDTLPRCCNIPVATTLLATQATTEQQQQLLDKVTQLTSPMSHPADESRKAHLTIPEGKQGARSRTIPSRNKTQIPNPNMHILL